MWRATLEALIKVRMKRLSLRKREAERERKGSRREEYSSYAVRQMENQTTIREVVDTAELEKWTSATSRSG